MQAVLITDTVFPVCRRSTFDPTEGSDYQSGESDYQTDGMDFCSAVNNGAHNIQLNLIKNKFTKTLPILWSLSVYLDKMVS